MLSFLNRARTKRANGEDGFTLIELLVVVVILGILIAIAIPVYLNYRKSANDKAAQSDLRGAISTLEVCNSDGSYPTAVNSTGATVTNCGTGTGALKLSTGTTIPTYTIAPAAAASGAVTSYIMVTTNSGGSKYYCYNSASGGSITTSSSSIATC